MGNLLPKFDLDASLDRAFALIRERTALDPASDAALELAMTIARRDAAATRMANVPAFGMAWRAASRKVAECDAALAEHGPA